MLAVLGTIILVVIGACIVGSIMRAFGYDEEYFESKQAQLHDHCCACETMAQIFQERCAKHKEE